MIKLVLVIILFMLLLGFVGYNAIIINEMQECKPMTDSAEMKKASQMAERVLETLNTIDASVVFMGRIGSDMSKYGMRFSHLGYVLKQPSGQWQVIHLINECRTDKSTIEHQSLTDFFLDRLFAYDALIVIPTAELQAKLYKILQSPLIETLHQPHYNMLAYPRSEGSQNSNQWVLEILIAAMSDSNATTTILSRKQILDSTLMQEYQPDTIKLDWLTRLWVRLFKPNINLKELPSVAETADQFRVATVRSVIHFLQKHHQVQAIELLEYSAKMPIEETSKSGKSEIQF